MHHPRHAGGAHTAAVGAPTSSSNNNNSNGHAGAVTGNRVNIAARSVSRSPSPSRGPVRPPKLVPTAGALAAPAAAGGAAGNNTSKLVYFVSRKGNNKAPVEKALARRSRWSAAGAARDPTKETDARWANFWWTFMFDPTPVPPSSVKRMHENPAMRCLTNHMIPFVRPIIQKNALCRTLMEYCSTAGQDPWIIAPFTIVVSPDSSKPVEAWNGWAAAAAAIRAGDEGQLWIVKPSGLNRGRGIEVCKTLEEVLTVLKPSKPGAVPPGKMEWVIQKYIMNPMLWHGRKFDIRVWALWTEGPTGKVYMFTEGYVRTSSDAFETESGNKWVHLTNYCLQKHSATFGSHEPGNTVSFKDFDTHIRSWEAEQGREATGMAGIVADIEKGIATAIRAARQWTMKHSAATPPRATLKERVRRQNMAGDAPAGGDSKAPAAPAPSTYESRVHQFELMGFDFMLDTNLKTWLIEVNSNPSILYQCDFHERLVDTMLDELFQTVVDPLFPTTIAAPAASATGGVEAPEQASEAWVPRHFKLLDDFSTASA